MPIGLFYIRSHRTLTNPAAADPTLLLNLTSGTFTRASSGSYYNGSTSSISWAAPNVLRVENRGDGYGNLYLLEGSRTNLALDSENIHGGLWSGHDTRFSGEESPAGGSNATVLLGTPAAITLQNIATTVNTSGTFSVFRKQVSGSNSIARVDIQDYLGNSHTDGYSTASADWSRVDIAAAAFSGTSTHYVGIRTQNDSDPLRVWGAQFENAAFPTSYISTSAVSTTRASDQLSFSSGTWPDEIRTAGFSFDVYPEMSSDELKSGSATAFPFLDFYAGGSAGVNGFGVRYAGVSTLYFRIYVAGVQLVTTNTVSWNRNQKITLICKPNEGVVSVSGCVSGNGITSGTVGTFPTGTLSFFSTHNGLANFFGRISNIRRADYVDLFSQGTFTRASSGSYYIKAPNDGSSPFLSWAVNNERRPDARDGTAMLLMEGSRTNYVRKSDDFSGAQWAASQTTVTPTTDTPDGISRSGTIAYSATVSAYRFDSAINPVADNVAMSVFVKNAESKNFRMYYVNTLGTGSFAEHTSSTSWTRPDTITSSHATAYGFWNAAAVTQTASFWCPQIEVGEFATSPIQTAGATTTRSGESLSLIKGEYPATFLSSGFRFTFAPIANSDQFLSAATAQILLHFANSTTQNYMYLTVNAGAAQMRVRSGSTDVIIAPLTWLTNQPITFDIKPSIGELTIAGAQTGNGTSTAAAGWTYPNSTFHIGSRSDGNFPAYGRFGQYITALTGT